MVDRGVIKNRELKNQVADMSGLRWGNITPTDIDAFLDFGDRLFVLVEGKYGGADVQHGQMLAIQRLCDATHFPPRRYSYAIIADHYTPDGNDIDFANMIVRTIRFNGKWVTPKKADLTLRRAIEKIKAYVDNKTRLRVAK
jgi:hypothetical protein